MGTRNLHIPSADPAAKSARRIPDARLCHTIGIFSGFTSKGLAAARVRRNQRHQEVHQPSTRSSSMPPLNAKPKKTCRRSPTTSSLIRADMEKTAKNPAQQHEVDVLREEMRALAHKLDAVATGKPVTYKKTRKHSVVPPVPKNKLRQSSST